MTCLYERTCTATHNELITVGIDNGTNEINIYANFILLNRDLYSQYCYRNIDFWYTLNICYYLAECIKIMKLCNKYCNKCTSDVM